MLALEFGVGTRPETVAEVLRARIDQALRRSGLDPEEVWAAVVSGPPGDHGRDEPAAVSAALGANARVLEPSALIGDTDGASAAFQLVTALAHANDTPRPDGTIVLITSVDPDGQVGCGVFRVGGRRAASAAHRG